MGIKLFKPSSSNNGNYIAVPSGNPDPFNYTIVESVQKNNFVLLKIRYHGCTNYEGLKILLFKDVFLHDLLNQTSIDPHFSDNNSYHSPIARFEPTNFGWNMALSIIERQ